MCEDFSSVWEQQLNVKILFCWPFLGPLSGAVVEFMVHPTAVSASYPWPNYLTAFQCLKHHCETLFHETLFHVCMWLCSMLHGSWLIFFFFYFGRGGSLVSDFAVSPGIHMSVIQWDCDDRKSANTLWYLIVFFCFNHDFDSREVSTIPPRWLPDSVGSDHAENLNECQLNRINQSCAHAVTMNPLIGSSFLVCSKMYNPKCRPHFSMLCSLLPAANWMYYTLIQIICHSDLLGLSGNIYSFSYNA